MPINDMTETPARKSMMTVQHPPRTSYGSPAKPKQDDKCHLLSLPAELKGPIFEYVVYSDFKIALNHGNINVQ
jgi:hypothetical protein